jgi:hypothetical protein
MDRVPTKGDLKTIVRNQQTLMKALNRVRKAVIQLNQKGKATRNRNKSTMSDEEGDERYQKIELLPTTKRALQAFLPSTRQVLPLPAGMRMKHFLMTTTRLANTVDQERDDDSTPIPPRSAL